MINTTAAFKAAITGDSRRTLLRAIVDIIDPDIVYGAVTSNGETIYSKSDQLHNKVYNLTAPYATDEHNRWLLDGTFIYADDATEVGFESNGLFNASGEGNFFVEMKFSGVSVLQSCALYFPTNDFDGYPVDFTVEIKQGNTVYYTETFSGNTKTYITVDGFSVYNPTAIRVRVTKWSLPNRRMRLIEIVPGIHEVWDNDIIATFGLVQQASFTGLSLPYGTCSLSMDNLDRRFEPRNKDGIFESIEDRQGIDIAVGVQTVAGPDFVRAGVYYQFSGGWKTGDNGLTMKWDLVDIIGLLVDQSFDVPATLPTTLQGWIAILVSQLGTKFSALYSVDQDYADIPCTVLSADAITGQTCGQILLWLCQATQTFPRADSETGFLAIEPFWNEGNTLALDNLNNYPVIRANEDIARIDFVLSDGTSLSFAGTSAASPNTATINNPFLHTQAAATATARMILASYGGNQIETVGRGDPSSEIGDVATVELDESTATVGRIAYQTFQFQSGVMQGCQTKMIQADGWKMYSNRVLLTTSGTWTAPAGVTRLSVAIGQGGQGGMMGQAGNYSRPGADGAPGAGGKVWYGTIPINEQQTFAVNIGAGGSASSVYGTEGAEGSHTTFGEYSSVSGAVFENGYTDIQSGDSFARTGVIAPIANTADGGIGGTGGDQGIRDDEGIHYRPRPGAPGVDGASGFVLIYYEVPS